MEATELMNQHLALVLDANKVTNITRISSMEEGYVLHIEDSLVGLAELCDAPEGLYGDLGTGAGFPGIPLAVSTGRTTMLIDSTRKKTAILDTILEKLGVQEYITTYTGRIEDLALDHPRAFAAVTARALSKLSVLMELSSPLLIHDGVLICYKANIDDDEMNHALELQKKLGMYLVSDRDVVLSDGKTRRRIVCFEKKAEPTLKLPRKVGFAQKRPL